MLAILLGLNVSTHWVPGKHICISKLTIIASDNVLSPGRHQATNGGILWIGPLGTKFSRTLIEIHEFSFKKMHLKMSFEKCVNQQNSWDIVNIFSWSFCFNDKILKAYFNEITLNTLSTEQNSWHSSRWQFQFHLINFFFAFSIESQCVLLFLSV